MRHTSLTILYLLLGTLCFGQSDNRAEILEEGTRLYLTEMASWYGTDIFIEKFGERRQRTGGYFSYVENKKAVCIFFSNASSAQVIASFSFDSTYNVATAQVDSTEREFSEKEYGLFLIRQIALSEIKTDTLFKSYRDMSLNLIPLNDEKGKRVYVLTGPAKDGIVVFGNDYLLTFDENNKLLTKRRLHKNLIPIQSKSMDGKVITSTMHSHLPETGNLITATDICTLKLYARYTSWGQHYVISQENISVWDCKKEKLGVMTKEAWDNITKSVKENTKKREKEEKKKNKKDKNKE